MVTKYTTLAQIMKDALSICAIKYQLPQIRDLHMSSNYTILAHYVYNMY